MELNPAAAQAKNSLPELEAPERRSGPLSPSAIAPGSRGSAGMAEDAVAPGTGAPAGGWFWGLIALRLLDSTPIKLV